MRYIYKISVIIVAILAVSCVDRIGNESSIFFAQNVVNSVMQDQLNSTISYVSWVDKANKWYSAAGNESEQNRIEDAYFNKIEPRMSGDTIIVLQHQGPDIYLAHNGKSLNSAGSEWRVLKENFENNFEIIVSNNGDISNNGNEFWSVEKINPLDESIKVLDLLVVSGDIGKQYMVTGSGEIENKFINSPVEGQRVTIKSPLIFIGLLDNWYYNSPTTITVSEGAMEIELLSKEGTVIEGDNIDVEFHIYNLFRPGKESRSLQTRTSPAEPRPLLVVKLLFRGVVSEYDLLIM